MVQNAGVTPVDSNVQVTASTVQDPSETPVAESPALVETEITEEVVTEVITETTEDALIATEASDVAESPTE